MPTTSGTSVVGLQRLGSFPSSGVGWELRFASIPAQDRLNRVGTALHCVPISDGRFPVFVAYKLYAAGIRPELLNIPSYIGTEVWVRWFKAGLLWRFQRPD